MALTSNTQQAAERAAGLPPEAVDETGVPWRNRAAERQRKLERAERERDEMRAQLEEVRAARPAGAAMPAGQPFNPQFNPYAAALAARQQGYTPVDPAAIARQAANEAIMGQEYERELKRLNKDFPNWEDNKEAIHEYLKDEVGYSDDELRQFGPRDYRLALQARKGKELAEKPARARTPQDIALETNGDVSEDVGSIWNDVNKIAAMSDAELEKEIAAAKAKNAEGW